MIGRIRGAVPRVRSSMWFTPGLIVALLVVLAEGISILERHLDTGNLLSSDITLGASGSRGLLTAVGSSVLTVAATMFAITMSVIATASSTYGPRLVRNFMTDQGNQRVLGLFVGTFVYCLLVLRHIGSPPDGGPEFVPQIAVYGGIALALLCVGGLIYFLHHIAESIQVATLTHRVRIELEEVAERLYGDTTRRIRASAESLTDDDVLVRAEQTGYVTAVDVQALIEALRKRDGVLELLAAPGTYVHVGEPLARLRGDEEQLAEPIRRHVHIGDVRTPEQDVDFAIQQVVEVAVRAVSPSMNDPYTASNAVSALTSGLCTALASPSPPPGWLDEDDRVRLVWAPPSGRFLVDAVFEDVRTYAAGNPRVARQVLDLARRLLAVTDADTSARLQTQLDQLIAAVEASGLPEFDVEPLRTERDELR